MFEGLCSIERLKEGRRRIGTGIKREEAGGGIGEDKEGRGGEVEEEGRGEEEEEVMLLVYALIIEYCCPFTGFSYSTLVFAILFWHCVAPCWFSCSALRKYY